MSGRRRRLAGLGGGMLAPPPVGVVRLGSVIGAGLMRTTRARRRSCTPCRGPRHSAAPPPCKAAPRPPGTRPSPTPTFSRRRTRPRARGYPPSPRTRLCCRPPLSPTRARRTWLPSTRRARSAVGWAPCPPPSAWGSGAASLRHRRLGEGGWLGSPPGALCTRARPRSTACTRQLRSPPPCTKRLFAPSCSSPEKLIRAIKEEPLSPQGVLDHKYSLSHEEPGAHLGDAKACSE